MLTEAQGTLAPTTKPELVYISTGDREIGRVSGDDATDMQRFAQYKELEYDDYEPKNNAYETTDGVLMGDMMLTSVMLGGVDAVDWYEFNSTADNQKWIFTVGGGNASRISKSITDANGKSVAATVDGASISYTVPKSGTKMYLKLTASTSSLFNYTLSSEMQVKNYTVQFGASDYVVMADADSIEIPIVLNKLNYKAGAITVLVELDDITAFNQEVFFPKGNYITYRTNVTWTAVENKNNNDFPKTKFVTLMLGDTENERWWAPGEKEKTVIVTLSTDTEGVKLAAENTTATIHIRNANNPVFVGQNGDGSNALVYETFTGYGADLGQTKRFANCIFVPAGFAGNEVFWELVSGEIPEGIDIDIQQHAEWASSYDIVVRGTSRYATETSATLQFLVRKEAGKRQLIRGDEFTVNFTVAEKREARAATRGGWNLMAIPWDMKVNDEQEQTFLETNDGNIYTSDGSSYVKHEGHRLEPGCAYWFFVKDKKDAQERLTGVKDKSVNESAAIDKALKGREWFFGADPGADRCDARWIWNGRKFVPAFDETDGAAGWWHIYKR